MNKELKSFTIVEALLSLLILSVIISLTYVTFNLFNRQMLLLEKENNQVLQYNLFNKTIKYDINVANGFETEDNKLVLKKYNNLEVHYRFENTHVLRIYNEVIDTFKLAVTDYKLYGAGKLAPVKRLELNLNLLEETITAHYLLNQNNAELINKKYFNEN